MTTDRELRFVDMRDVVGIRLICETDSKTESLPVGNFSNDETLQIFLANHIHKGELVAGIDQDKRTVLAAVGAFLSGGLKDVAERRKLRIEFEIREHDRAAPRI
jgi:hypothetical protein